MINNVCRTCWFNSPQNLPPDCFCDSTQGNTVAYTKKGRIEFCEFYKTTEEK